MRAVSRGRPPAPPVRGPAGRSNSRGAAGARPPSVDRTRRPSVGSAGVGRRTPEGNRSPEEARRTPEERRSGDSAWDGRPGERPPSVRRTRPSPEPGHGAGVGPRGSYGPPPYVAKHAGYSPGFAPPPGAIGRNVKNPHTTPVGSFLRCFGLQLYAKRFCDFGFSDLEALSKLRDGEALELLNSLRAPPEHALKLARAVDSLRVAVPTDEEQPRRAPTPERAATPTEEAAAAKEREAEEAQKKQARDLVRRQDKAIQEAAAQIRELEVLLEDRTKQTFFLTEQLQGVLQQAEKDRVVCEQRVLELEARVRISPTAADTAQAALAELDLRVAALEAQVNASTKACTEELTMASAAKRIAALEEHLGKPGEDLELSLYRSFDAGALKAAKEEAFRIEEASRMELHRASVETDVVYESDYEEEVDENEAAGTLPEAMTADVGMLADSGIQPEFGLSSVAHFPEPVGSPPARRASRGPEPASQPAEVYPMSPRVPDGEVLVESPRMAPRSRRKQGSVRASLDSAPLKDGVPWKFDVEHMLRCLARALQDKVILSSREPRPHTANAKNLDASVIFLEPTAYAALRPRDDAQTPQPSPSGRPAHPLNDIAVRRVPNMHTMYGFLRNAMHGWRLRPEVAVVTLVYVERFEAVSGVKLTVDNWQRLAVNCMMLASKVWDDDSYENQDFAKACPLYSVDEINTMERVMLNMLDYKVLVNGAEYASVYFRLRVLGAREQKANPLDPAVSGVLQPLDNMQEQQLARRGLEKQNEWREKYHAHLHDLAAVRHQPRTGATPLPPDPDPLNWTL